MEDYNLMEKIQIMTTARVVLSIDGTSIINAIFSKQRHIKAVAIRPYDFTKAVGIALAPFQHVEYLPIVVPIAHEKYEDYEGRWYTSDLFLPISLLKQKLNKYNISPI